MKLTAKKRGPGRPKAADDPVTKCRNLRILNFHDLHRIDPEAIAKVEDLTARQVRRVIREARTYAPAP